MGQPSFASEFPNDNAAISGGAIWVGAALTGPATLELAPHEPVPNVPFVLFFEDDDPIEGPVDLRVGDGGLSVVLHSPAPAVVADREPSPESASTPEAEPPAVRQAVSAPAFAHFESALAAALMAQGASRSAALLPRLLRLESIPMENFSKEVWLTLQSRGYLDSHGRYAQKFRELCGAWSAVLSGASEDFASCGTTTLDRFGADLLAALLAVPTTRADELRRQLRRAGIAAFGVLEAA